ncbi:C40 family peptidase [Alsobacter sp. SYSU M60028]|uniref:C40 family peptidase n=1 Tax=Alsobacter ponti TaxID=2962936 RepID=A0ABT1LAL5_9HYPH|nr:NlpC/P60 family protein [Alsobacter ponti]MCP8938098.1 C40 family peptidase [Alsobacter ponti]
MSQTLAPRSFDRRLTPARPDLAAAHLRGVVEAARYVEGRAMRVLEASAAVRREPSPGGALDTEALHGEAVTAYEFDAEGWVWGQLARDSYVGWMPAAALIEGAPAPTHRVHALRTFVYPGPSIKLPPVAALSLGSEVEVLRMQGDFAVTPLGAVFAQHLRPLAETEADFVAVAERFVGVPYLWGGKTSLGLDCSGLVQLSLAMCGVAVPRDSDMQEATVGAALPADLPRAERRRGDLVFWKGHVGMLRDADTLLHANGHHMLVESEDFDAACARILAKTGAGVTTVRRLPG